MEELGLNAARIPHPKRGILTIKYPIGPAGLPWNWDDLEKLMHNTFYNELRLAPELRRARAGFLPNLTLPGREHPVAMPMHPTVFKDKAVVEKMTQIMFETWNVPALSIISSDVASVFAVSPSLAGTALVVHSGFDSTVVSSCQGGVSVPESVVSGRLGGGHVSLRLMDSLLPQERLSASLIDEVKAKLCFVAPVPIASFRSMWSRAPAPPIPIPFEGDPNPNGSVFLKEDRFEAPEIIFSGDVNMVDLVLQSVRACDPKTNEIVLTGGNCNFPGLADRLELELHARGFDAKVINRDGDRSNLAYAGAALYAHRCGANPALFEQFGITKEQYDEHGPTLCHARFSMPLVKAP